MATVDVLIAGHVEQTDAGDSSVHPTRQPGPRRRPGDRRRPRDPVRPGAAHRRAGRARPDGRATSPTSSSPTTTSTTRATSGCSRPRGWSTSTRCTTGRSGSTHDGDGHHLSDDVSGDRDPRTRAGVRGPRRRDRRRYGRADPRLVVRGHDARSRTRSPGTRTRWSAAERASSGSPTSSSPDTDRPSGRRRTDHRGSGGGAPDEDPAGRRRGRGRRVHRHRRAPRLLRDDRHRRLRPGAGREGRGRPTTGTSRRRSTRPTPRR